MKDSQNLSQGINLIGYFDEELGLAEDSGALASRFIFQALIQSGIPVRILPLDDLLNKKKLSGDTHNTLNAYPINLFAISPYDLLRVAAIQGWAFFKDHTNIGLAVWDVHANKDQFSILKSFLNEIWTTSSFLHRMYSQDLQSPVYSFPQPYQLNYLPTIPSKKLMGIPDRYTFLITFNFKNSFKKSNPYAVIDTFLNAFPKDNQVQLLIHTKNGSADDLRDLRKKINNDMRIIDINAELNRKLHFDLMNCCDCYLSLHRAEELGVSIAEALLLGKPVICSDYQGNNSFINQESVYLCDTQPFIPTSQHPIKSSENLWVEPNIPHAAELMIYVRNHPQEALKKALVGRKLIEENHNLKLVGEQLKKHLSNLFIKTPPTRMPLRYLTILPNRYFRKSINLLRFVKNKLKTGIKLFSNPKKLVLKISESSSTKKLN